MFSNIPKKLNKKGHVFGSTWTVKGFRSSKLQKEYEEIISL